MKIELFCQVQLIRTTGPFSQQTYWVIAGVSQVLLITLTMALLYRSVPACHNSVTVSQHKQHCEFLPSFSFLLFTTVLFLLPDVKLFFCDKKDLLYEDHRSRSYAASMALSQPDRQNKCWHNVLYVSLCGNFTFLYVQLSTLCCDDTVLTLWSG